MFYTYISFCKRGLEPREPIEESIYIYHQIKYILSHYHLVRRMHKTSHVNSRIDLKWKRWSAFKNVLN